MAFAEFTFNYADGFWYGPDRVSIEELTYMIHFLDILDGDSIESMTVESDNIDVIQSYFNDNSVQVKLNNGVALTVAEVRIEIVTVKNRTYDRAFRLNITS